LRQLFGVLPIGNPAQLPGSNVMSGKKIDNHRQFLAIGEGLPFTIFVNYRQTSEAFTLNPIMNAYFRKLIGGNAITHTNF
jgi:hypothetical protein